MQQRQKHNLHYLQYYHEEVLWWDEQGILNVMFQQKRLRGRILLLSSWGGWIEDGSSALARGLVDHSYLEPWNLGSALARHSSMMQHLPLYHLHTQDER